MDSAFGGLEQGLMLLVLVLGAAVLVLALVFMIVSLGKVMQRETSSGLATAVPTPASAPKEESATSVPVEPPAPAVAVVEEPVVVPKAKSDLVQGDEIPDELLPILIAAAATAIGKPVRVKDVVLVNAEKPNVWGTQGRIVIQRSHDTGSHQW